MIESGLNPKAYSYAHASGVWQFISSTAKIYGLKKNWWVDERRDFEKSTRAAAHLLKNLYKEFDDWYLAFAAYNCGSSRVKKTIKRQGTNDYWKLTRLPPQTRNYVPNIMAAIFISPGY
jgi:membrane-bound lytic murein transglycosylase D